MGTVVLDTLVKLSAAGKTFARITLIGHSTGAVYINEFIRQAAARLANASFDVVFLAPANRFEDFDDVLTKHGHLVANFRMFAMTDQLETEDQLVSIIYPRSLLYLISGVLEGEPDMPIMGMQRFIADKEVFNKGDFKAVDAVRSWLAAQETRAVWSISTRGNGLNAASRAHGDVDNDAPTIESVKQILHTGF